MDNKKLYFKFVIINIGEIIMNEKIKKIIEFIDWAKIQKVMDFLNWTWLDDPEPPTVGEIMISAQKYMTECYQKCENTGEESYLRTGGHEIKCYYEKGEIFIEYGFVLESYEV